MRATLFFLTLLATVVVAVAPANAAQPVYAVREHPEVTITGINAETKRITVELPGDGGAQALRVVSKTWIIKDGDEASFADLRVGQRLHVWLIPRGAQAVALEVLPPKDEK